MIATAPAATTALSDLLLARLVVAGPKPPGPKRLRDDLGQVLGRPPSADEFAEVVRGLTDETLVTTRPLLLTEAGRSRALAFLGVAELPPRANWATVKARFLLPRALGLSPEEAGKLTNADRLAAFLLRRKHGLPDRAGATVSRVAEALVCRALDVRDETTVDGLVRAKLGELVGTSERLTKKELVKQLPRTTFGLPNGKLETLRRAALAGWLGAEARPEQERSFDLPAFARTVIALARTSPPADRFGENKVFIAGVWQASQREPNFPRMALADFKARLVEANRDGLLQLSRADLVEAMDPALVAESETGYLNATFHFVRTEGGRP